MRRKSKEISGGGYWFFRNKETVVKRKIQRNSKQLCILMITFVLNACAKGKLDMQKTFYIFYIWGNMTRSSDIMEKKILMKYSFTSPIFNVLINRIIFIDEINEIYNCYNEFYNLWYKNIFARLQFGMTPIKMKLNKFRR